ncbi:dicarboxylate/amino acid:cation symporter [Desulfosarcina widdelii]|uniref:Dicarboxylate/amino acid:cation symporter n=1 Tax=Desulfosarcina widdelii TaxID=947919 RepID=A0A5K7Z5B5_9BACT|nr:dicarboxylate/amino acid:cation symporter [Desulfosarcina widdelii]BBO75895.1 dicarboxylate/amino acid:cation symporter [Desulfosarcina widdelii]
MKNLYKELWFQVMTAMVMGLIVGLVLSPFGLGVLSETVVEHVAPWIALPGNLFLAMIKMVVIPLVLSSIILGITSSEDINFLKRVSMRIFPYFVATTMAATAIGAGTALVIQPGNYIDSTLIADVMENSPEVDTPVVETVEEQHLTDRLIDLIPTNYIKSALNQDMLATVILALFIGMAMVAVAPDRMKPMFEFIGAVQDISMKIIEWAMKLAPIAVFALICNITMRVGVGAIVGMAAYMGAVVLGLLLLLFLYLFIVWALGRMSPLEFLKNIGSVQLLAFSTSSSAATIPLAMTTAEERLKVDGPIARFIIPLGATINMDGTALYQVCATVFLSQVYGVAMGPATLVAVIITTVGASIGTPSTPGVGIVILATILQGIGIPPSGIALIIGVDRILDMTRTTVNVSGDLTASVVMNRLLKNIEK